MWDNIGRKLQALAKVICWLGIIGSVIWGIVLMNQNSYYQPTTLTGILYIIIGCLGSWIGSWALYGLGLVVEYVENSGHRYIPSTNQSFSQSPQPQIKPKSLSTDQVEQKQSFIEEMEKKDSMIEIWNIWRQSNLGIAYPSVNDYIRQSKDQEQLHGEIKDVEGKKKTIIDMLK